MSFEKKNKKYKKAGFNLETSSKMDDLLIENNVNDILKNIKQHTNTNVLNDLDVEQLNEYAEHNGVDENKVDVIVDNGGAERCQDNIIENKDIYSNNDINDNKISKVISDYSNVTNNNINVKYLEKQINTGLTKEKSIIEKDKYLGNINYKNMKDIEDKIINIEPYTDNELILNDNIKNFPKKLGYSDVEKVIKNSFYTKQDYYSSAFDIIATYIKGQKLLYIEAEYYCKKQYHMMIFPAIFISALTAVLSLSIIENNYGPVFVSSLCAFNGFLISLANYSKLNVASEAHKITAKQYEKLQTECEFTSGKMMILPTNGDEDNIAKQKLEEVEGVIKEIKEINKNQVPRELRRMLPKVNNTNVFSLVKQITNYETLYINNIKDELNELRVLEYKEMIKAIEGSEKLEMREIRKSIKNYTRNLLELRNEYNQIDVMFRKEIQNLTRSNWFKCLCCSLFEKNDQNAKLKHLFNSNI